MTYKSPSTAYFKTAFDLHSPKVHHHHQDHHHYHIYSSYCLQYYNVWVGYLKSVISLKRAAHTNNLYHFYKPRISTYPRFINKANQSCS